MEQGTSEPRQCEVCGGPINRRNKYGICTLTKECITARAGITRSDTPKPEPRYCRICGTPIRSDNEYGICKGQGKPLCAQARDRETRRRKRDGKEAQRYCEVCNRPIRRDNRTGICGDPGSRPCRQARKRRLAELAGQLLPPRPAVVTEGDVFGRWTALETSSSGEKFVLCRCACGTERPVRAKRLVFEETQDCGCVRKETPRKPRSGPYLVAGSVYGRYAVLEDIWHHSEKAKVRCECGAEKVVLASALRYSHTKSCGCLKLERISSQGGFSRHPLYGSWNSMLDRCTNPKDPGYGNYGASGITVCDRWLDPWLFAEDIEREIGVRPPMTLASGRPLYTLDRIDPELGYLPGNVRWATASEQNSNQRKVGPLMSERNALAAEVERLTRLLGDAGL